MESLQEELRKLLAERDALTSEADELVLYTKAGQWLIENGDSLICLLGGLDEMGS